MSLNLLVPFLKAFKYISYEIDKLFNLVLLLDEHGAYTIFVTDRYRYKGVISYGPINIGGVAKKNLAY